MLLMRLEEDRFVVDALRLNGTSERLGALPFESRPSVRSGNAPYGEWFAVSDGREVNVIEVGDHDLSEPRRLGPFEGPVVELDCDPLGRFVAARYEDGQIRLWDIAGELPPEVITGPSGIFEVRLTEDGSLLQAITFDRERNEAETWIWSIEEEGPSLLRHADLGKVSGTGDVALNSIEGQLVSNINPDPKTRLWPLRAPADAEPVIMQRDDVGVLLRLAVHPEGQWLATSGDTGLTLWPVAWPSPAVVTQYEERVMNLVSSLRALARDQHF